jgi:hypothetical protein
MLPRPSIPGFIDPFLELSSPYTAQDHSLVPLSPPLWHLACRPHPRRYLCLYRGSGWLNVTRRSWTDWPTLQAPGSRLLAPSLPWVPFRRLRVIVDPAFQCRLDRPARASTAGCREIRSISSMLMLIVTGGRGIVYVSISFADRSQQRCSTPRHDTGICTC